MKPAAGRSSFLIVYKEDTPEEYAKTQPSDPSKISSTPSMNITDAPNYGK
jgi:hypothetical protein